MFSPLFVRRSFIRTAILADAVFGLLAIAGGASADVSLPAMFTDHAVLQRDMPLPVWGWAEPGEKVTVSLAGQTQKATADKSGKWSVTLKPLQVGEPLTLVVEGKNRIERKDLLVGEVWLCSGQSNMEFPVAASHNGDLGIAAADHPDIRLITVRGRGSQTPVEDFDGQWEICSPTTVPDFSAVGYYFGRELHEQLGVPIGLIDNSWGDRRPRLGFAATDSRAIRSSSRSSTIGTSWRKNLLRRDRKGNRLTLFTANIGLPTSITDDLNRSCHTRFGA